jgi:hypothetical protein
MSRRSDQLRTAASNFLQVHHSWANDQRRPSPDEIYWDAVEDLIGVFNEGDIPGDCRKLAEAVDTLADELEVFDDREDEANVYPHAEFWSAREAVEKAFKGETPVELKPLESIPSLRAQGVSDRQIALMYGFKDAEGNLLIALVQKEIESPGSVLDADSGVAGRKWTDPRLAERAAAAEAEEKSAATSGESVKHREAFAKADADAKPCKETPRELWEQNVGVKQSAKMLKQSEPEVAAMFAEFDREAADKLSAGGEGGSVGADGGSTPMDETTRQILKMHDEKIAAGKIAKKLGIDVPVVLAAVERHRSAADATVAAAGAEL